MLRPVGERGWDGRLDDDLVVPFVRDPEHDLSDRQRDDQRVESGNGDEDAVDEPDQSRPTQADEDRDRQLVIRAVRRADDDDAGERDHAGNREVDAAGHDDEHLAERGDGEEAHQRQHGAERDPGERLRER